MNLLWIALVSIVLGMVSGIVNEASASTDFQLAAKDSAIVVVHHAK